MILKIFLFFFFTIFSFANSLVIDKNQDLHLMKDFLIYEDKNNLSDIKSILEDKTVFGKVKKNNIGIKKYPIWTYNKIKNTTNKIENLIFSNPRSGIDFINVYITHNNKVLDEITLGDMVSQNETRFIYRKSDFALELLPNKEYEIFIRYKSYGPIDLNWEIYNKNSYVSYISKESLIFGFIAGFVVLISSYIIFIDRLLPSMSHKLYFVVMIGSLSMQFSITGILYQIGVPIYLNTILSWSFGNFAAACIGFFPIYFFDLKKLMPKTTLLLYILSFILLFFAILFLFYPLNYDLLYLSTIANSIFLVVSFILGYVSINLYLKKIDGAIFYLFANTSFTIAAIYFSLGILGLVKADSLFYFSLGIGSIFNILFIGMLIVRRLLRIKKEKDDALVLINEYSKLSNIGQSMVNISHQWKEPINHIYYAVNNIIAAKEFKDPNLENIIDSSIDQIKDTAKYMTNTAKDFLSIYQDKTIIKNIEITKSIELIIDILKKDISQMNVKIEINSNYNNFILADKYLVSNVLMIVLENSIKTFRNRNIKKPRIGINITNSEKIVTIKIADNAGGVKEYPIDSIFKKDLTNSNSTGLGLFLAKNILTMKLYGDISVQNLKEGACFTIVLKDV